MIIWSGMGFLVALITIGCLVGTEYFVEASLRDEQYYQTHGWPKLVAFLIAGAIVGVVGRGINRWEAHPDIDPDTGARTYWGGSSFFFIPMQYWGPILAVLGVVFLFVTD